MTPYDHELSRDLPRYNVSVGYLWNANNKVMHCDQFQSNHLENQKKHYALFIVVQMQL